MVDSYKSSVSDAKAYAKRLTVVSLADRDKAREERKQEKEEEDKKDKLNQVRRRHTACS